jgi:hypothetical protein
MGDQESSKFDLPDGQTLVITYTTSERTAILTCKCGSGSDSLVFDGENPFSTYVSLL